MSQVRIFCDRQTEGLADRQTDGRMSFNVPRFRERRNVVKMSEHWWGES